MENSCCQVRASVNAWIFVRVGAEAYASRGRARMVCRSARVCCAYVRATPTWLAGGRRRGRLKGRGSALLRKPCAMKDVFGRACAQVSLCRTPPARVRFAYVGVSKSAQRVRIGPELLVFWHGRLENRSRVPSDMADTAGWTHSKAPLNTPAPIWVGLGCVGMRKTTKARRLSAEHAFFMTRTCQKPH